MCLDCPNLLAELSVYAGAVLFGDNPMHGVPSCCATVLAPNCKGDNGDKVGLLSELDSTLDRPWDYNWDGRHDNGQGGQVTRTLVFVRHGQYESGDTDEEKVLTPLGREQARLTGKRLQEMYEGRIDKVVYSTMTRATETANIIRKELPATIEAETSSTIREGIVTPATLQESVCAHACNDACVRIPCIKPPLSWYSRCAPSPSAGGVFPPMPY